jgi:hypothetical protein
MVSEFELDKRTGIDLPHEVVSTTPSRNLKPNFIQAIRMER